MQTIVGVRFKKAGKIYYFDPGNLSLAKEDPVIVETARGLEFGHVVIPARQMAETEVVTPLKPVLRKRNDWHGRSLALPEQSTVPVSI